MTSERQKPTILCISTYEKGQQFIEEAARLGCDVVLLTLEKHEHADWPLGSLKRLITMPSDLTPEQVLNTVSYHAREQQFDRIVPLDEFDLEIAALVREHLRLPGMGESETRYFRDKLAMRQRAQARGVPVPEFTSVFHYPDVRDFLDSVQGPWLLKPRTSASALGIRKFESPEQIWPTLDQLGDLQSHYLLERFVPGEIFHVEGITWNCETVFAAPYKYGKPPLQTMHHGGVFSTRALKKDSNDARELEAIHLHLLQALGMVSGVTHSEFIKADADGKFYFLETAARVGGAHIADVVELANGINPWVEWARIEVAALLGRGYRLPPVRPLFAGSVISLARQERPDLSGFDAPEVVRRLEKYHHAGLLLQADSAERIEMLVEQYSQRFLDEFCAFQPPPDKPTE